MSNYLLWLTFVITFFDWLATAKEWKGMRYLTKPGVMLVLLAWLWVSVGIKGYPMWFGMGLVFSMIGDILLMLPDRFFIAGAGAFLCAHLSYIVGFNQQLPPINLASLVIVSVVVVSAWVNYHQLSSSMKNIAGKLLNLVRVYTIVISVMLLSATLDLVRPGWATGPALLTLIGAALFFTSDTFLAWDRFVKPLPYRGLLVMITYHLGQIALIAGVVQKTIS